MYKLHFRCRACGYGPRLGAEGIKSDPGSARLMPAFSLGLQPLANDFVDERSERAGYAPLEVLFCPCCTLAQLSVVVRPEVLYQHYLYVTSPSETMRKHFWSLMEALNEEQSYRSVLEIGSNDGALLKCLSESEVIVAGIDPAENLAELARREGIPTATGTFSRTTAEHVLRVAPKGFDLILARHVFCHVDDWREFVDCLAVVSHRQSLVAIEVPYVKDLLERGEFDTIYHEHTSYLSLRAMHRLLVGSAWRLHRVKRFPVHGGAIVIMLRRVDSEPGPDRSVRQFLEEEEITLDHWSAFSSKSLLSIGELSAFVAGARSNGKKVAGLGASAKSTVWVNACHFTRKDLAFITDTTTQKLWKLSPGSDIPIVDEGAIVRELPDYVVCFAWNYRSEILEKMTLARSKGVKFVFPIPHLEVI